MSEHKLDQIQKAWQKEPNDRYVLKAATKDLAEYAPDVQRIIIKEAQKRGLIDSEGSPIPEPKISERVEVNTKSRPARIFDQAKWAIIQARMNKKHIFKLRWCFKYGPLFLAIGVVGCLGSLFFLCLGLNEGATRNENLLFLAILLCSLPCIGLSIYLFRKVRMSTTSLDSGICPVLVFGQDSLRIIQAEVTFSPVVEPGTAAIVLSLSSIKDSSSIYTTRGPCSELITNFRLVYLEKDAWSMKTDTWKDFSMYKLQEITFLPEDKSYSRMTFSEDDILVFIAKDKQSLLNPSSWLGCIKILKELQNLLDSCGIRDQIKKTMEFHIPQNAAEGTFFTNLNALFGFTHAMQGGIAEIAAAMDASAHRSGIDRWLGKRGLDRQVQNVADNKSNKEWADLAKRGGWSIRLRKEGTEEILSEMHFSRDEQNVASE